jgi:CBS-domain-containing membrane protein
MGAVTTLQAFLPPEHVILFAPLGASSALIFAAPDVPFSQPRNVIGGHMVSAFAGAGCCQMFTNENMESVAALVPDQSDTIAAVFPFLAVPMSVSLAIGAMLATRTMHPPAAATAMLAVAGPPEIQALGMSYVLHAGAGSTVLMATGVFLNAVVRGKDFPKYWW